MSELKDPILKILNKIYEPDSMLGNNDNQYYYQEKLSVATFLRKRNLKKAS